tara:strand:+ start:2426 stop:4726 length:2301 start_codon:yes stop_codon:yes gene_type:complete
MTDHSSPSPFTPIEKKAVKISVPKKVAAGIPATMSTMKHSVKKMGLIRTAKSLTMVNQKHGFDCPGCAWPDPSHATSFEFCENGAKAVADEAMKKTIGKAFFSKFSIQELSMKSDYWLNNQGRLSEPLYKKPGDTHYRPLDWDDAFSIITSKMKSLANPNRAVFYTSGRTSNEAAFLYQLMVRQFGTNNLPDCSNMCHESSGKALSQTIGIGKGTVYLEDFNKSDLILVIGQNPGTNHPRMLTALRDAKRNGAKIIHVNPLPETGLVRFKHPQDYLKMKFGSESLADLHLQVKIGSDSALMIGLMKILLEKKAIDQEFIDDYTEGFNVLCDHIRSISWAKILQDTGLELEEIQKAGEYCMSSNATIACWAMGLTQHKHGVAMIQEVSNLLLMGGHIGKPGAGLCPVRGHSNVQGDRTVGIWERPTESFLLRLEKGTGITAPREHGFDVVEAIHAMYSGDVDLFFSMGGNFVSATPDTQKVAKGLSKVALTIQVSTKLNRSHLVTGDAALILPCLGRTESDIQEGVSQFVTVENSMGVVHQSQGRLNPTSDKLKSEVWIVSNIANSLFGDDAVPWSEYHRNYDTIRELISQSIYGFDDYNARVRRPGGFYLPNPPRDERKFETSNKKANFIVNSLPDLTVPQGKFVMMTIRSHDQYNTTIYGHDDRYRGIKGNRRVVLMNGKDMVQLGIKSKQLVDISSHFNGKVRTAEHWLAIPYDIPKGNVATYFPEANQLIPLESTADLSNTPTSKWVICSISPSNREIAHEEE